MIQNLLLSKCLRVRGSLESGALTVILNTYLAFILAALAFIAPFTHSIIVSADRSASVPNSVKENPYHVGEQLNYSASWSNVVVAGELSLQTKDRANFNGTDGYHVRLQARSTGFVDSFVYKVDDVYESFINAATLEPFRAESRSRHGKESKQGSLVIDQQHRTARLADGRTLRIPPDTYDLASLFYALRTIDLTPGKTSDFTLLEDGQLYSVRAEPEGRETVHAPKADYDAVRVAIKPIEDGRVKDSYKLRLYLTSDTRRLPVLLTAEPFWGRTRVELTSASGTKPAG
jgi:uncharacterized protein DUF3108